MGVSNNQPRQPKGTNTGGQYAAVEHSEASVDLTSDVDDVPSERDLRLATLRVGGYVPAVVSSANFKQDGWWRRHALLAERNHPDGDRPAMASVWSVREDGAPPVPRRSHVMSYANDQVSIRMPSITSIREFSLARTGAKEPGETFDVPVSAQFPGGACDGWVRVVAGEGGEWATQGLGFSPKQNEYVAESVQCLLESRRPSRALREVGDLLERRRLRAAMYGVPIRPMNSSWMRGLAYEQVTGTMFLMTETQRYGFRVPQSTYLRIAQSPRPGVPFNLDVRGVAERRVVNECEKCGRVYATDQHRCPLKVSPRRMVAQ